MGQTVAEEAAERAIDVEVVEERNADAYGFTVKVLANGLLHRILPVRDPHQPRFWCVVVFRCSPGGIPDASEQPWVGLGGLRREELKENDECDPRRSVVMARRTAHGQLRDWMLAPGAAPAPSSAAISRGDNPTRNRVIYAFTNACDCALGTRRCRMTRIVLSLEEWQAVARELAATHTIAAPPGLSERVLCAPHASTRRLG